MTQDELTEIWKRIRGGEMVEGWNGKPGLDQIHTLEEVLGKRAWTRRGDNDTWRPRGGVGDGPTSNDEPDGKSEQP